MLDECGGGIDTAGRVIDRVCPCSGVASEGRAPCGGRTCGTSAVSLTRCEIVSTSAPGAAVWLTVAVTCDGRLSIREAWSWIRELNAATGCVSSCSSLPATKIGWSMDVVNNTHAKSVTTRHILKQPALQRVFPSRTSAFFFKIKLP